jgi:2-amino-4-hydroxy-6-hydroxymethyldihydropteridine diphosphokinase/dihydropteroate synthase
MKCVLGLGSNMGDRRGNLEKAARALKSSVRATPVFETPALVPDGSPSEWNMPFLNAVLEIEWTGTPLELLGFIKSIEKKVGRTESERWAPRVADIDVLRFGALKVREPGLYVPHPEMMNRQFVLCPLKHLDNTVLPVSRSLPGALPAWMGILNITPDSFSGSDPEMEHVQAKVDAWLAENVHMLDIGAESTRPGAKPLTHAEEWKRLRPVLEWLTSYLKGRTFRPWLSVDTYHPETAARALELGVDIINDVSGLSDGGMIRVLQSAPHAQYVLMHSLSVPADPKINMRNSDPVSEVKSWARFKLKTLQDAGIDMCRVIFDPGFGFGKTAPQSLELMKNIRQFMDLPVRILSGHSRKSLYNLWGERPAADREWESVGASLRLAERGVDILRVHEPTLHARAHRVFRETGA